MVKKIVDLAITSILCLQELRDLFPWGLILYFDQYIDRYLICFMIDPWNFFLQERGSVQIQRLSAGSISSYSGNVSLLLHSGLQLIVLLCVQLYLTLWDTMDYSPPGSSVSSFQARILEWVAMPFPKESSWPRDQIYLSYVSCIGSQELVVPGMPLQLIRCDLSDLWKVICFIRSPVT